MYEILLQTLRAHGYAVGEVQGKRLYVVYSDYPEPSLMVALENDGCYVHSPMDQRATQWKLVGAGFDLTTAPAVTTVLNALLEAWNEPDARRGLIGVTTND